MEAGAFLTSLSKDPHLHLAHALLPTPVHVENHQYMARGPTVRTSRTLEPVETESQSLSLVQHGQVIRARRCFWQHRQLIELGLGTGSD